MSQHADTNETVEAEDEPPRQPPLTVRKIDADQPWTWLARGWHDLCRVPALSLPFGIVYAGLGIAITLLVAVYDVFYLTGPLMAGFMLVGPLAAVGLYQISRSLSRDEPVSLGDVITAWRHNRLQIALMGLVLMLILLAWMRIAQLIFALFNSYATPPADFLGFIDFLLATEQIPFLIVGTAVGGAIAAGVFAVSAISIPLLVDRPDRDVFQAISTSLNAVNANFWPMALWAWLVALFIGVGLATGFLGLIVTLPLIGHATWHAYQDLVGDPDEASAGDVVRSPGEGI